MKRSDHAWMYRRLDRGSLSKEFVHGVEGFMEFATEHTKHSREFPHIWCPCIECRNLRYSDIDTVKIHLYQKGFCMNYFLWYCHGEEFPKAKPPQAKSQCQEVATDVLGPRTRVYDAFCEGVVKVEEDRKPQVKRLRLAKKPSKISIIELSHSTASNTLYDIAQLEEGLKKAEKIVEKVEKIVEKVGKRLDRVDAYLKETASLQEQFNSRMEKMEKHLYDVISEILENQGSYP